MKTRILLISLIAILVLSACSSVSAGPQIEIQDPWVRAAKMMGGMESMESQQMSEGQMQSEGEMAGHTAGSNSGAFFVIKNTGGEADKLIAAASDVAETVEIHLSEMKDGVMTMRQVPGIDVPARGQAELKPGSYHVMLINIQRDLNPGDKVSVNLEFEKAGTITIEAEVRMP